MSILPLLFFFPFIFFSTVPYPLSDPYISSPTCGQHAHSVLATSISMPPCHLRAAALPTAPPRPPCQLCSAPCSSSARPRPEGPSYVCPRSGSLHGRARRPFVLRALQRLVRPLPGVLVLRALRQLRTSAPRRPRPGSSAVAAPRRPRPPCRRAKGDLTQLAGRKPVEARFFGSV
jgi:hypothetical protein